jgi:hypothetical protein
VQGCSTLTVPTDDVTTNNLPVPSVRPGGGPCDRPGRRPRRGEGPRVVVGVPAGHAPLLLSHLVVDVVLCFPVFFLLLLLAVVVAAAADSSVIGCAIAAAAADSSAIGYAITAAAVPCGGGIVAGTRAWLWGGNTIF